MVTHSPGGACSVGWKTTLECSQVGNSRQYVLQDNHQVTESEHFCQHNLVNNSNTYGKSSSGVKISPPRGISK